MGSTQQHQQRQRKGQHDEEVTLDEWGDPKDWIAEVPKFGLYHRGYTTNHWLQVFRTI